MKNEEINREELKARCDAIRDRFTPRNVKRLSSSDVYETLRSLKIANLIPSFKSGGKVIRRGRSLVPIFRTYVKFLIEESLQYPIDIYIPHIGFLKIKEVDSVGRKSYWRENGKSVFRMDTPFDKSVMYKMYGDIFGTETKSWMTKFILNKRLVKPILRKVYLKHPEGGFYSKYTKKKS